VKSLGGLYPDTEIVTPSAEDYGHSFNEYTYDAYRRLRHDTEHPNERRQVKPGEEVHQDESGHVQVAGDAAVMGINGLLTKVIFDKNPYREFYLEESFPLDWMYPYLEPFGIIMHINRHPMQDLPQDMIDRDHVFWCEYSRRTVGNWITYDTSVKDICDWADQVYLRHDLSHFTGDPKFVRDDDAQSSFSKLRLSIASSIYMWRANPENSRSATEKPRVTKEAEFALKQAFAYCPFSVETVFRFMNFLLLQNRIDDAILVLETCQKLDPYNAQVSSLIDQLKQVRKNAPTQQVFGQIQQLLSQGESNAAARMLDQLLNLQGADPDTLRTVANFYLTLRDFAKSEQAIRRVAELLPNRSDSWYNLATVEAFRGEVRPSIASLKKCLNVNAADLRKEPRTPDLRKHLFEDPNFAPLRGTPEFKAAFGTNS
jgi:tetratricopeptide (TPR) repeat protein